MNDRTYFVHFICLLAIPSSTHLLGLGPFCTCPRFPVQHLGLQHRLLLNSHFDISGTRIVVEQLLADAFWTHFFVESDIVLWVR